jgi:hypothetical protein
MKKLIGVTLAAVLLLGLTFTGGYVSGRRASADTRAVETLVSSGWSLVPPTTSTTTTVVRR